jgi:MoaA/NifB/PqqE/SkfB family radical SAM enzyme
MLPFHQIAALLEQFQPFAEHVTLTGGEPLLYPWIGEVIELLSGSEVSVTFTTNATMLGEELVKKLLGLTQLKMKVGNVNDSPLQETWNSDPLLRTRKAFRRAKLPRQCTKQLCPVVVGDGTPQGEERLSGAAGVDR